MATSFKSILLCFIGFVSLTTCLRLSGGSNQCNVDTQCPSVRRIDTEYIPVGAENEPSLLCYVITKLKNSWSTSSAICDSMATQAFSPKMYYGRVPWIMSKELYLDIASATQQFFSDNKIDGRIWLGAIATSGGTNLTDYCWMTTTTEIGSQVSANATAVQLISAASSGTYCLSANASDPLNFFGEDCSAQNYIICEFACDITYPATCSGTAANGTTCSNKVAPCWIDDPLTTTSFYSSSSASTSSKQFSKTTSRPKTLTTVTATATSSSTIGSASANTATSATSPITTTATPTALAASSTATPVKSTTKIFSTPQSNASSTMPIFSSSLATSLLQTPSTVVLSSSSTHLASSLSFWSSLKTTQNTKSTSTAAKFTLTLSDTSILVPSSTIPVLVKPTTALSENSLTTITTAQTLQATVTQTSLPVASASTASSTFLSTPSESTSEALTLKSKFSTALPLHDTSLMLTSIWLSNTPSKLSSSTETTMAQVSAITNLPDSHLSTDTKMLSPKSRPTLESVTNPTVANVQESLTPSTPMSSEMLFIPSAILSTTANSASNSNKTLEASIAVDPLSAELNIGIIQAINIEKHDFTSTKESPTKTPSQNMDDLVVLGLAASSTLSGNSTTLQSNAMKTGSKNSSISLQTKNADVSLQFTSTVLTNVEAFEATIETDALTSSEISINVYRNAAMITDLATSSSFSTRQDAGSTKIVTSGITAKATLSEDTAVETSMPNAAMVVSTISSLGGSTFFSILTPKTIKHSDAAITSKIKNTELYTTVLSFTSIFTKQTSSSTESTTADATQLWSYSNEHTETFTKLTNDPEANAKTNAATSSEVAYNVRLSAPTTVPLTSTSSRSANLEATSTEITPGITTSATSEVGITFSVATEADSTQTHTKSTPGLTSITNVNLTDSATDIDTTANLPSKSETKSIERVKRTKTEQSSTTTLAQTQLSNGYSATVTTTEQVATSSSAIDSWITQPPTTVPSLSLSFSSSPILSTQSTTTVNPTKDSFSMSENSVSESMWPQTSSTNMTLTQNSAFVETKTISALGNTPEPYQTTIQQQGSSESTSLSTMNQKLMLTSKNLASTTIIGEVQNVTVTSSSTEATPATLSTFSSDSPKSMLSLNIFKTTTLLQLTDTPDLRSPTSDTSAVYSTSLEALLSTSTTDTNSLASTTNTSLANSSGNVQDNVMTVLEPLLLFASTAVTDNIIPQTSPASVMFFNNARSKSIEPLETTPAVRTTYPENLYNRPQVVQEIAQADLISEAGTRDFAQALETNLQLALETQFNTITKPVSIKTSAPFKRKRATKQSTKLITWTQEIQKESEAGDASAEITTKRNVIDFSSSEESSLFTDKLDSFITQSRTSVNIENSPLVNMQSTIINTQDSKTDNTITISNFENAAIAIDSTNAQIPDSALLLPATEIAANVNSPNISLLSNDEKYIEEISTYSPFSSFSQSHPTVIKYEEQSALNRVADGPQLSAASNTFSLSPVTQMQPRTELIFDPTFIETTNEQTINEQTNENNDQILNNMSKNQIQETNAITANTAITYLNKVNSIPNILTKSPISPSALSPLPLSQNDLKTNAAFINSHSEGALAILNTSSPQPLPAEQDLKTNASMKDPCQTAEWEPFSSCSATCGDAIQIRRRKPYSFENQSIDCPITDKRPCDLPKCNPMDEIQLMISKMLMNIGCAWIMIGLGLSIICFFCFRHSYYLQIIHVNEDISLLLAHLILMLFAVRNDEKYNHDTCKTAALALQYFFGVTFSLQALEALHIYTVLTDVVMGNSALIGIKSALALAWGVPAVITGMTGAVAYNKLMSDFACWINAGENVLLATFVPVATIAWPTVILLEATGFGKTCRRADSVTSCKLAHGGLYLVFGTQFASWFMSSSAVYYQHVAMFTVVFGLNVLLGIFIYSYHVFSNEKVRNASKTLYRRIRGRNSTVAPNF